MSSTFKYTGRPALGGQNPDLQNESKYESLVQSLAVFLALVIGSQTVPTIAAETDLRATTEHISWPDILDPNVSPGNSTRIKDVTPSNSTSGEDSNTIAERVELHASPDTSALEDVIAETDELTYAEIKAALEHAPPETLHKILLELSEDNELWKQLTETFGASAVQTTHDKASFLLRLNKALEEAYRPASLGEPNGFLVMMMELITTAIIAGGSTIATKQIFNALIAKQRRQSTQSTREKPRTLNITDLHTLKKTREALDLINEQQPQQSPHSPRTDTLALNTVKKKFQNEQRRREKKLAKKILSRYGMVNPLRTQHCQVCDAYFAISVDMKF